MASSIETELEAELRKIRGEAVYGPDVREAISRGIELANDLVDEKIDAEHSIVSGYKSQIDGSIDTLMREANEKPVLVHISLISGDRYLLELKNLS